MAIVCHHFTVKGLVQGVWFRKYTKKQADTLGIKGYVKNCRNGDVEVIAYGEEETVAQLAKWLWQGSPQSNVHDVLQHELQETTTYDEFSIH